MVAATTAAAQTASPPKPNPAQPPTWTGINSRSLEAYRDILRAVSKENPFSLLTQEEEEKFQQADSNCIESSLPDECSKGVGQKREKLINSRQKDVVRLTPPKIQLDVEGQALRLARLPEWHPEKRMMTTFLAGLEPYLNQHKPPPDAAGRACLEREAKTRAQSFATALIEKPIVDRAEARERDRRLAIMSKLAGDASTDRPRVERSSTFEDAEHKRSYRARSEAFIQTTQESIRAMEKTFHDRETEVIYKNWELQQELLRACRESKAQCL
jgi:hypothetical protein